MGALVVVAALLALACASSGGGDLVVLRWPEPPQATRIEYVRSIRSPADLVAAPSALARFLDFLLATRPEFRAIGHPSDIELSPGSALLYVSDFAQGLVHVFDLEGGTGWYIGLEKRFQRPFGLALDAEGRLYVVEQSARQIRVVDPAGTTVKLFPVDGVVRPTDIEIDQERGRLYVVDGSRQASSEHYVRILDLDGNPLGEIGKGKGVGNGQLMFPTYLALDAGGNLYVSDTLNSRVSVFDPDGKFLRAIGRRGDGPGMFDKPKGIAFDGFGNLYVADSSWSNVQIFGPQDDVLLFFGGRGSYPGLLKNPTSLAIARDSNTIYVGDYLNHRIDVYRLLNSGPRDGIPEIKRGRSRRTTGGRT